MIYTQGKSRPINKYRNYRDGRISCQNIKTIIANVLYADTEKLKV